MLPKAVSPCKCRWYLRAMSTRCLVIIGAGGHGAVVLEAASSLWDRIVLCDDSPDMVGRTVLGKTVVDRASLCISSACSAIVAVGGNATREMLAAWATQSGLELVAVAHPSAVISPSAVIEPAAFVAAGAVVGARARLARGAILNTCASIDHDSIVKEFAHIGPGAHLCGNVAIGARTLIGAGTSIIRDVEIGDDCVIGAGAAVVHSFPSHTVAVGVPAKGAVKGAVKGTAPG